MSFMDCSISYPFPPRWKRNIHNTLRLPQDSSEESVAAEKKLVIIKPSRAVVGLKYASLNFARGMLKASNDMQRVHLT